MLPVLWVILTWTCLHILFAWCVCSVPGPTQLPPPPPAGQDSSAFASNDRSVITTTISTSAVQDSGPELPRRLSATTGSHSRSSSLDNQLIDLSDAGRLLVDLLLLSLAIFAHLVVKILSKSMHHSHSPSECKVIDWLVTGISVEEVTLVTSAETWDNGWAAYQHETLTNSISWFWILCTVGTRINWRGLSSPPHSREDSRKAMCWTPGLQSLFEFACKPHTSQ